MDEDNANSKSYNGNIATNGTGILGAGKHTKVFPSEHADESMSMLMREDDAEILELGVEHNSEPPTPYTGPDSSSVFDTPPSMDIGESAIAVAINFDGRVVGGGLQAGLVQSVPVSTTCSEDVRSNHLHASNDDPKISSRTRISMSAEASAENIEVDLQNQNIGRIKSDDDLNGDYAFDDICEQDQRGADDVRSQDGSVVGECSTLLLSTLSVSHDSPESKMYHRRLHEAAQFAEAVGEPQDGMIQVIIDDDDDDSDDDSDSDADGDSGVENDHIEKGAHAENHDQKQDKGKKAVCEEDAAITSASKVEFENRHSPEDLDSKSPNRCDTSFHDELHSPHAEETYVEVEEKIMSPSCARTGRFPSERSVSEGNLVQLDNEEKEVVKDVPKRKRSSSYQYFFRHKLPLEEDELNGEFVVFKGIVSPEVTKRGISRGNYAQLHRKAWLEVSDKYHRYGKNLRTYYKHWEKLGHPTNMFFDWLDVKGEAAGWELPNLPECPREQLDNDRVKYITDPEEQAQYLLKIDVQETPGAPCRIVDLKGEPAKTGPSGWIFVLRDHELYGAEKCTKAKEENGKKYRFHHSSFFGGKAVAAAGIIITDDNGCLRRLYPHSGHYRPGEADMQRMLYHLYHCGVDLRSFLVDMQQIMHVSREVRDARTPKGHGGDGVLVEGGPAVAGKKAKKTDSLHLKDGTFVALFLAHKARSIGKGLFKTIHKIRPIRRIEPCSVTIILNAVDHGGFWARPGSINSGIFI